MIWEKLCEFFKRRLSFGKRKKGKTFLRTSTEIYWWVGKHLTVPEPTRNPTLGARLALLSRFNPSVLRSDGKPWQCSWQALIAWFVLDQYHRYDQLRPVYAESLEPERIMVFLSPGRWGNSVRVALLSGPWPGTGPAGCTIQIGWQRWVWGGAGGDRYPSLTQPGGSSQPHGGGDHLDSSMWDFGGFTCALVMRRVEVSGAVNVTFAKMAPLFIPKLRKASDCLCFPPWTSSALVQRH